MTKLSLFVCLFCAIQSHAQHAQIYPTNWWTGMKWNKVQLLIHGENSLANEKIKINYPGITITKTTLLENPKYLAADITITATAKPGTVKIEFSNGSKKNVVEWPLKARRKGRG